MKLYKNEGIDSFALETVTIAEMIMKRDKSRPQSFGMSRYSLDEKKLTESPASFLYKAVMDFLSEEFPGLEPYEVEAALMNDSEAIYDDWVSFCERAGINSITNQYAGWEMIFGNEYTKLPGMDKFF